MFTKLWTIMYMSLESKKTGFMKYTKKGNSMRFGSCDGFSYHGLCEYIDFLSTFHTSETLTGVLVDLWCK